MKKTVILWDIENVNLKTDDNLIASFIEEVSSDSLVSYSVAIANWNKDTIKGKAKALSYCGFELIHLPVSKKDSSDFSLVAKGVELIFQLPHIDRYILIAGDADFRPLVKSLKKFGKEVIIVCDVANNTSEELLLLADKYHDYRDFLTDGDDSEKPVRGNKAIKKQEAFSFFEEAVSLMIEEKKTPAKGSLKVKMKLLDSSFDEKSLEFPSWNAFCDEAVKNTNVRYDENISSNFKMDTDSTKKIAEVFTKLLDAIGKSKDWCSFSDIAKKIPFKDHGYTKFKNLALDAEKRGYIILSNKNEIWTLKRK